VAFINGEPVEAAKALRDFARANPALVVKGGVMDGKALTADEVRKLADLESREVLLAKMAGALLASLSNAVYLFNAPLAQAARLAAPWRPRPPRTRRSCGAVPARRRPPPRPPDGPRGRARHRAASRRRGPHREADVRRSRRPARRPGRRGRRTPTAPARGPTHPLHPASTAASRHPCLTGSGRRTTPPPDAGTGTAQKETPPWRSSAPTSSLSASRR
jgi:hypothetical protein